MIVLTADHIDVLGQCQFSIEADGASRTTKDPVAAAKILSRLGVANPLSLVEHACEWGSMEILEDVG
jgi:hypothetical protein